MSGDHPDLEASCTAVSEEQSQRKQSLFDCWWMGSRRCCRQVLALAAPENSGGTAALSAAIQTSLGHLLSLKEKGVIFSQNQKTKHTLRVILLPGLLLWTRRPLAG